jgi:hypothetical protein
MTSSIFEATGGSVPGRAHVRAGRNNQDAFAFVLEGELAAAVVCDGCSGSPRSEVGAALGARLLARALVRCLGEDPGPARPAALLARARGVLIELLGPLGAALGGPRAIADCLLFTVVGLLVGRERAAAFALGDGLVVINGERFVLGPYPGNEPPYLGYALLEGPSAPSELAVVRELPSTELRCALLGTDGALDLGEPALAALLGEERLFRNLDGVRRRLAVASRQPGRLLDDTTLVLLRRRRE